MAYSDNRGISFSPASLAGTIGFNGLVAAAAILATVSVLPKPPEVRGTPIWIDTTPIAPPPKPSTEKPDDKPVTRAPLVTSAKSPPVTDNSGMETTTALAGSDLPLGPVGTIIEPVIEPIIPPKPVETAAFVRARDRASLQPDYPIAEQRMGNEGRVTVRVLIGTDGRVKQVEAVSATSDAFFKVTREQALRKWRFEPATRDGVKIVSWQTMSVRFEMPA